MKCERARELINGEYDEALADRELLEAHVSDCDACRLFRTQMDGVVAGLDDLRSLTDVAIDQDATPVSLPWRRHLTGTLRVAAVLAMFVVGGLVAVSLVTTEQDRPVAERDDPQVAPVAHAVEVRLMAESRDRFIPVVKPTGLPRVHLVWLYTALPKPDGEKPRSAIEKPSKDDSGQLAHRNPEAGVSRDGDTLA